MPAMPALCLGCSVQGAVLNPCPTCGWQDIPCPPWGTGHLLFSQAGLLGRHGA